MRLQQLLRYVGSKTQLLADIKEQISIETFPYDKFEWIEPFCGSIVVPLYMINDKRITHFHLNDINPYLIRFFKELQQIDNIEPIITYLKTVVEIYEKDKNHYYEIRRKINDSSNMNSVEYISSFLFINRTCFNGVSRYNRKGEFNVPLGKINPNWNDIFIKLKEVHEQLRYSYCPITFHNESYETFIHKMTTRNQSCFIYCDPPYDNTFNLYNNKSFEKDNQQELATTLKNLHHPFLTHNTKNEYISDLYKGYKQTDVISKRFVSQDATKRGAITELMITNF